MPFLLLGGCSNQVIEYEKFLLTKNNIEDYLSINEYFTDINFDYIYTTYAGDIAINDYFTLSYIKHIETSKRNNCFFYECNIFFTENDLSTNIDINGVSHCSYLIKETGTLSILNFGLDDSSSINISIKNIEGYVLVPKD
jgi:hypothetical protein